MNTVSQIGHHSASKMKTPVFGHWHKKLLLGAVDLILIISSLFYFHKSIDHQINLDNFFLLNSLNIFFATGVFWIFTIIFNFYDLDYVNKTRKVMPLAFSIGIFFSVGYGFVTLFSYHAEFPGFELVYFIFGFTLSLIFWRVFYASVIHKNVFIKNCVLLTTQIDNRKLIHHIKQSIEGSEYQHGLKVLGIYNVTNDPKEINSLSRALMRMTSRKLIDTIIILDQDQEMISNSMNTSLLKIRENGGNITTYMKLYEEVKEALPIQFTGNQFYSILPVSKYNHHYFYLLWHKLLDLFSSLLGLSLMFLLSPVILFLNLFFNRGPLFYRQYRVGKGGKEILITKFRSMVVEAEKDGAKMSVKGDNRITSFGKILRKLRIDELPQFLSVIKGEMSLIGPRPERKVFIDELVKSIPLYDSRHLISPGITGWAQVKYNYGENIEDSCKKLEYDLYYIKNRSVTLDFRIIFKTINTIAFYKGQ
ncbi:sugar transferase [Lutimonas saemankumensis]|uniref:sugar transferase n=1 Tax=Lutimonas saemankumensis TaxID=483016 RepID=UPI001CD28ABC|nr:sugar transferase [Lutimonas saemankumensis]MCA0930926.1 sugar transferase [Lutimonas saemankumensis]